MHIKTAPHTAIQTAPIHPPHRAPYNFKPSLHTYPIKAACIPLVSNTPPPPEAIPRGPASA
ncbi:hypothetical protein, partial [Xylella taiwanensis]|uniref:hypothetical protein n=1 Tax=Xylella taiwanensis TaxID=1444770 RepID=UPI001F3AC30B